MRSMLGLLTLLLAFNAWSIDVTFRTQPKTFYPIYSSMTCDDNTCSCPADTKLDKVNMRCFKCGDGLVLDKASMRCSEPNQVTEFKKTDIHLVTGDLDKSIQAQESSMPQMCDMSTFAEGKFGKCDCKDAEIAVNPENNRKITLKFARSFNDKTQKCERAGELQVNVPSLSCSGPSESAFRELQTMGFVKAKYTRPYGGMIASCGGESGRHVLTIVNEAIKLSTLDAILLYVNPRIVPNTDLSEFILDVNSMNY
jgi:hypothetical protein